VPTHTFSNILNILLI